MHAVPGTALKPLSGPSPSIPGQAFVSDTADAEAICEAAQGPAMRFVGIKAIERQTIQSIHRMRSLTVGQRTAQINQIRGLLLEYGIEIPAGRAHRLKRLPEMLEDVENSWTDLFRGELFGLCGALKHFNERIAHYDKEN